MVSADRLHGAAALIALAFLAGCAADCTTGDWGGRGYADGYDGHPPQDLRLQRCAGFSQPAYLDGWRDGHDAHERLKTMNDI